MNTFQNLLVRLKLRRITQQDISRGIHQKDVATLLLGIHHGAYPVRLAAVRTLGVLRAKSAMPVLVRLLWDDFETIARAAGNSLKVFLPDAHIEQQLQRAAAYWNYRKATTKSQAIWYTLNNPLQPPVPMIDKSKMTKLAKVRGQLQKPIRFW